MKQPSLLLGSQEDNRRIIAYAIELLNYKLIALADGLRVIEIARKY